MRCFSLLLLLASFLEAQCLYRYNPFSQRMDCHGGGKVATWTKYALLKLANGSGGCASANGCWQVNGVLGANATAGVAQDVTLFALPANGYVSDFRIKTITACAGATTIVTGLGTTGSNVRYRAATFDLKAAVSATNYTLGPPAAVGADTSAATNVVASIVTTVENVSDITAGCAVDYHLLTGVLP